MKKALICLEQLGIGGVETFTITQVEEFARRKIKCYVLARDGLLAKNLKGLKNIEFIADPLCKKASYKMELPFGILRQDIGEELSHLLSVLTP